MLFEAEVAVRLTADNVSSTVLPALLFTAAACVHVHAGTSVTLARLAEAGVLFALYVYVFDASNQSRDSAEDALNKPHRPVPAGLITPRGARLRFWCAMPLYTLAGALTGTLVWVLLWQVLVVVAAKVATPRQVSFVKPFVNFFGTIAQLAAAWQLVTPRTRRHGDGCWSSRSLSTCRCRSRTFATWRDRRIGRPTLALAFGHWPVRFGFAALMTALPLALHLLLFAPSRAGTAATLGCGMVIAAMAWTAAARALLLRSVHADRVTYLLYTFTYASTLACGIVLL